MKTRIAIIAIAMSLSAIANNAQVWTKEDVPTKAHLLSVLNNGKPNGATLPVFPY